MKEACVPDTPHLLVGYQQTPNLEFLQLQVMSRTAKAWVETPSKMSSVRQRRDVIRNWVVGNGLLSDVPDTHSMSEEEKARVWKTVFEAVEGGISKLRSGKLDIYKSINAMVLFMEKKGSSGTTISGHTHKIVKLYRYLKLPVDAEDLKETVRKVDSVSVTDDRNLTRPEIRKTLIHGNPKQKALVSFLVCTGARLGEAVQVRLRDIDFSKRPVVVYFPARKTKTKRKRFSFISSECVELLTAHIKNEVIRMKSEWLFPGWVPGTTRTTQADKHISPSSAYLQIRNVFALAGLVPPAGQTKNKRAGSKTGAHLEYHPHVLRSTSLEIAKSAGYPTDWAEYIVGHNLGTQESYLPNEDKMAEEWLKRCEKSFCFLHAGTDPADVQAEIKRRIESTKLEMDDFVKEKVEEAFRKYGRPKGKPFDVLTILQKDEKAYTEAISNGYEEAGRINGSVIMKRKR